MKAGYIKRAFSVSFLVLALSLASLAETKYRQGLDALYAGRYDEAIAFFKKQVEKEKDTGELACHASFLLGLSYYRNGQYGEAITYLKRPMEIHKQGMAIYRLDDAWNFWLGRAYFDNRQVKEAISCFIEAANSSLPRPETKYDDFPPTYHQVKFMKEYYIRLSPSVGDCYFWAALALYSNGQYKESASTINKALDVYPKNPRFHAHLAACLRELKKYDEAIAEARKALELQASSQNYRVLGSIYWAQNDYRQAIEAYKSAIGLEPDNADNYLDIARIYMSEGKYPEAEDILKKAPTSHNVNLYLIQCLMGSGNFDMAISTCNQEIQSFILTGTGLEVTIVDKYPQVSSVRDTFPAGKSGIQPGDRIVSINGNSTRGLSAEAVHQAINPASGTVVNLGIERKGLKQPLNVSLTSESRIHTAAALPYGMKSLILGLQGNFEEAAKEARNAYALDPDNAWARRALGFSRVIEGSKPSEPAAAGNLEEAIKILSGSTDSFDRTILSIIYARARNSQKAAETFALLPEEFIQSRNAFYHGYVEVALEALQPFVDQKKEKIKALENNNQFREAVGEYALLMRLCPEHEASLVRKHLGQLRKSRPEFFDFPEEARKRVLRAEVLSEDKNFARALSEYREALKIAPFVPDIHKAMAMVAESLKDYSQAIKSLTAYLELNPDDPEARALKDKIIKWEFLLEEQKK